MSFIYLATPYTHQDPMVMETRYLQAMKIVAYYLTAGHTVYSPIVHYHELAKVFDLPKEAKFWGEHNMNMLRQAERMIIAQMPGWDSSVGIAAEVNIARAYRIPIADLTQEEWKEHTCQTWA